MSLDSACDELLAVDVLSHQYGIPRLWPKNSPSLSKSPHEEQYYSTTKELSAAVNKLVYLDQHAELRKLDRAEISALYEETFSKEPFASLPENELAPYLASMIRFKGDTLTTDYLTMALPVLRSIYQENTSLTDSEFTILNNLKKLYSRYNEHPANVRRLLAEYNVDKQLAGEEARVESEIVTLLSSSLKSHLAELHEANTDLQALQNTYRNRLAGDPDAATDTLRKSRRTVASLSTRMATISVLCDLLPNLVLCHASNWFSDKTLRRIVEDCQDVAEKLASWPEIPSLDNIDEFLQTDFEAMVFA